MKSYSCNRKQFVHIGDIASKMRPVTTGVPQGSIVYRPGYFTVHPSPAPSGPKFSNPENCCKCDNAMQPIIFWDMEGHRGNFRSKNIFWKKFIRNHIIFKFLNMHFVDTNTVILKKQKISPKMCLYVPEKQH